MRFNNERLAQVDISVDTGDFYLMDIQVLDILNAMPEKVTATFVAYLLGLVFDKHPYFLK
jgi:hypothetical protein